MADQPINGLPKKTAAADTDALLMIGASEEYQIDYGKLADAILNKLTNKTFALDQGSKSLVAALNELNSKIKNIIKRKVDVKLNKTTKTFIMDFKNFDSGTYIININCTSPESSVWGDVYSGIISVYGGYVNTATEEKLNLHHAAHNVNSNPITFYIDYDKANTEANNYMKLTAMSNDDFKNIATLNILLRRVL